MIKYLQNPDFFSKFQDNQFQLISADPNSNEIFAVDGPAALILNQLFEAKSTFTKEHFLALASAHTPNPQDAEELWQFCLNSQFFLPQP